MLIVGLAAAAFVLAVLLTRRRETLSIPGSVGHRNVTRDGEHLVTVPITLPTGARVIGLRAQVQGHAELLLCGADGQLARAAGTNKISIAGLAVVVRPGAFLHAIVRSTTPPELLGVEVDISRRA